MQPLLDFPDATQMNFARGEKVTRMCARAYGCAKMGSSNFSFAGSYKKFTVEILRTNDFKLSINKLSMYAASYWKNSYEISYEISQSFDVEMKRWKIREKGRGIKRLLV